VISGLLFGPALFLGFAVAVCVLAGRYPRTEPPIEAAASIEERPAEEIEAVPAS